MVRRENFRQESKEEQKEREAEKKRKNQEIREADKAKLSTISMSNLSDVESLGAALGKVGFAWRAALGEILRQLESVITISPESLIDKEVGKRMYSEANYFFEESASKPEFGSDSTPYEDLVVVLNNLCKELGVEK